MTNLSLKDKLMLLALSALSVHAVYLHLHVMEFERETVAIVTRIIRVLAGG